MRRKPRKGSPIAYDSIVWHLCMNIADAPTSMTDIGLTSRVTQSSVFNGADAAELPWKAREE